MRIDGICLITGQVGVMARFYREVLKAGISGEEGHVDVFAEGAALSICSHEIARGMGLPDGDGNGRFTLQVMVDDADAEYERLKKLNVHFVSAPKTHPWGARSFQFFDPDGNLITFAHRA